MKEDWWSRIEEIFNKAIILPKKQRYEFIESLCISDIQLRDEILALLSEDELEDVSISNSPFNLGTKLNDEKFKDFHNGFDFGHYKIKEVLGRGGMGLVFLAEDTRLERLVAIKIMPPNFNLNKNLVERFEQEAKTASLISHPNVAHIYDFGLYDERYFLVMEYIKGKTLREAMIEETLSLKDICEIALELAKALNSIHHNGIIHRDIKPENIIITDNNSVKLLDFGLAKFHPAVSLRENYKADKRISINTAPGILIGTSAYMSPEQIRAQKFDNRTDIWSFGAVFYECIAKKRPFDGQTKSDIHAAILLLEPEPISKFIKLPEIIFVIENSLKKNNNERDLTIDEIITKLKDVLRTINSIIEVKKDTHSTFQRIKDFFSSK